MSNNLKINPGIDFLRGSGCVVIMLYHVLDPKKYMFLSDVLLQAGLSAMSMFFTISAYIILASADRSGEKFSGKKFLIKRFFRIIPVWWFFLFFLSIAYQPKLEHIIANIFFYFGFLQHIDGYNYISLAWSLFVEETFYILFPFVFILFKGLKRSMVLVLICFSIYIIWTNLSAQIFPNNPKFIWSRFPLAHFIDFSLGFLFYYIQPYVKLSGWKRALLLISALGFTCLFSWTNNHFLAGLIISICFIVDGPLKDVIKLSAFKPFRYLGVRCLSLYLVHDLIQMIMIKLWKKFELGGYIEPSSAIYILIFLGVSIFVSHFTHKYVELKSKELGEKFLKSLRI